MKLKKEDYIIGTVLLLILFIGLFTIRFANYEGNTSNLWVAAQGHPSYFNNIPNFGNYGPILPYMMKLPLLFYNHPYTIFFSLILFHIGSSYLIYLIGKEFFNDYTGIVALLLYAFSTHNLKNTLLGWSHNFIPFFALLFIYSIYKIKFKKNTKYYIALFGSLSVMMQIHIMSLYK